ncbi:MAG TPA: uracil-DNA glycosylase [Candidatus Baltobacteraceae bacterium]|jgi:DNA polymerase|nr:uracil-DNA glycosylase [Candidatus Baltobacteraceae bacterium]
MNLAERERREDALIRAAGVVEACRACAIGSTRTHSVYGEGDPCAAVMVIGEGPGETEDQLGRPFVGRAGELLNRMLAAIDLKREDVFICNTVKCRPTFDDGNRLRNRAPDSAEMENCRPYLDEQIEIIAPKVILCLGAPSAKSFLGPKFAITKQRGQWFTGPHDIPLLATFHPAYILRQTGGELNAVKRMVWEDLKAVRGRLNELAQNDLEPIAPPVPMQTGLFGT